MVLRDTILLGAPGVAIGLPVALGSARLVESLLYGIESDDAGTIVVAVGILMGLCC